MKLSKSCITDAEKKAVMRVLDSQFFGMGKEVQSFEEELSEFLDTPAICVVNGTAALQLALEAIGVGPGDEVLVQSLTYVASFQAITATGASPVACDVDAKTCTLSVESARNKITSKTKAIMPVHYAGGTGDLEGIYGLAREHNLRVVEDAAHAFGSRSGSRVVGSFGDVVCFSFDGIKNITSGEGGCIASKDKNVLDAARDARLLGVVNDTSARFSGGRSWDSDVTAQGWRYHMSDIMAAIGREQLSRRGQLFSKRQVLAKQFITNLEGVAVNLEYLDIDYSEVVPHIMPVLLPSAVNRDLVRTELLHRGIPTGIHYKPNHLYSYYCDTSHDDLSVTNQIYPRLLTLPLHPDLEVFDVDHIVKSLVDVLTHAQNA